jgi:hypothetical protein
MPSRPRHRAHNLKENMKTYTGTKILQATPMSRADYNTYRGWQLPENENGADDGYLVEYTDGGKGNDTRHAGYISWSPKVQFDQAYLEIGDVSGIPAHQQRVIAERASLADKHTKLGAFFGTQIFKSLVQAEREDLAAQHRVMGEYLRILGSRIARFGLVPSDDFPLGKACDPSAEGGCEACQ